MWFMAELTDSFLKIVGLKFCTKLRTELIPSSWGEGRVGTPKLIQALDFSHWVAMINFLGALWGLGTITFET